MSGQSRKEPAEAPGGTGLLSGGQSLWISRYLPRLESPAGSKEPVSSRAESATGDFQQMS
jgi:hypothetical protein